VVGAEVGLSVRPEHLYLEGGEGRISIGQATILDGGFFGTHHQCIARLEGLDEPVKVRLPQKQIPRPGEELALYVDPADMVLLTR